jgi:hypothetical protein
LTVSRAAHKNRRNINYPKKQKKTKKKKKVYHFLSVLKYESCMSKSFFFLVEIYLFIFFVQCHKFFFLEMYVRGKKCRSLGLQQQPLSISAFQTKKIKRKWFCSCHLTEDLVSAVCQKRVQISGQTNFNSFTIHFMTTFLLLFKICQVVYESVFVPKYFFFGEKTIRKISRVLFRTRQIWQNLAKKKKKKT